MSFVRFLAAVLPVFASVSGVVAADQYRKVLTTTGGESKRTAKIESTSVTPECPHKWSILKSTLRGGRQEGVELLVVDNGKMQITVCPTRGMGIINVVMGDLELKWDSPVRDIVNPQLVNLNSRGGLGWLEGFNEFMCRCGRCSPGHSDT